ncbi:MAG: carbohydrate ABC transporter permease, partial [Thermomicrobiales bacterium]
MTSGKPADGDTDRIRSTDNLRAPGISTKQAAALAIPHPTTHIWNRRPWLWFILPAILAYSILFIYPTLRAFYLSIFDWSGIGPIGDPVGLKNFRRLLTNDRFWNAATNSAKLFLVIFVLQNTISLGLALLLNRKTRMTHVYRTIIFLPVVISAVATGIIWVLMLDPQIGVIN